MSEIVSFAQVRRHLQQNREATIYCPCCGTDTGIPYARLGRSQSPQLKALRERMRKVGVPKRRIIDWVYGWVK